MLILHRSTDKPHSVNPADDGAFVGSQGEAGVHWWHVCSPACYHWTAQDIRPRHVWRSPPSIAGMNACKSPIAFPCITYSCIVTRHQLLELPFYCAQELPEQWNNVKKQAVLVKQAVAPLQTTEVGIIRKKLISFDVKQHEFREDFRRAAPFNFDSEDVYMRIDEVCL